MDRNISPLDMRIINRQLSRPPRGLLGIACRCFQGRPGVIVTHPFAVSGGFFPTNWWLSCPLLRRAIGFLEGQGGVGLAARQGWGNLGSTHARYALRRQGLMSWRERWELFRSSPEMYRMLVDQGVGGTTSPGGIKCLHAHYADWLMEQQNPVGAWVQGLLMSNRHLLGKYAHSCLICHGEAVSPVDGIIISPNKVQAHEMVALDSDCLRAASLDIGTNSLRILIGQGQKGKGWHALYRGLWSIRLGEGLGTTGLISPAALARLREAGQEVAHLLDKFAVREVRAVATSAVREAGNGDECLKVLAELGIDVQVISGREEGLLSFRGALRGMDGGGLAAVIDVGGGSTEVAVGLPHGQPILVSVPLGAVKAAEGERDLGLFKEPLTFLPDAGQLLATGGTATSLAAVDLGLVDYDVRRVHGHELSRKTLSGLRSFLADLPLDWRRKVPGLDPARADIIVPGARILEHVMDLLGFTRVRISESGILDALLDSVFSLA
jgi:exopolyphosphatase/guanosine-5'-triphosphate,3'-diphosphate pyrophosphatase